MRLRYDRTSSKGCPLWKTHKVLTCHPLTALADQPWAHGWSAKAVNGWQVSTLWVFHSGQPFDEVRSYLNLIGNPFASGNGVTIDHKFSAANGGTLWVNPTAFCDPSAGDPQCTGSPYGNVSRNKWYAPGYGDIDLSFIKNIRITERVKIQLRADFFNLFNRKNLTSGV